MHNQSIKFLNAKDLGNKSPLALQAMVEIGIVHKEYLSNLYCLFIGSAFLISICECLLVTLDMSFWRKIVNDYREGFHGVISQPKSPKIANFGNPSWNGSKLILKQKKFFGYNEPLGLSLSNMSVIFRLSPRGHFGLSTQKFFWILKPFHVILSNVCKNVFTIF